MAETLNDLNSTWIFEGGDDAVDAGVHRSEKSVRELVISKQNNRIFPVDSRLVGRMEEQLVRWKRPPSSHMGTVQIIEGTHPYQQEPLSMGQTLAQIRDSFTNSRKMFDNVPSTNLTDVVSGSESESFKSDELPQFNSQTCNTTKAVPVMLKLPRSLENDSLDANYSYHYPIPEYYLAENIPRTQPLSGQLDLRGFTCLDWLCFGC